MVPAPQRLSRDRQQRWWRTTRALCASGSVTIRSKLGRSAMVRAPGLAGQSDADGTAVLGYAGQFASPRLQAAVPWDPIGQDGQSHLGGIGFAVLLGSHFKRTPVLS